MQEDIYINYLFDDFIKTHRRTFSFPNWDNNMQNIFYTWNDQVYKNFMMDILFSLEPRIELANKILFDELEEMNEVLFIDNGVFEIGYDFNGEKKFPIRYKNTTVIGAYGLTFNKRSQFIYRTVT